MLRYAGMVSLAVVSLGLASCGEYTPGADSDPPTSQAPRDRTDRPGGGSGSPDRPDDLADTPPGSGDPGDPDDGPSAGP
uniref:hypothetical protein n=1 Tax=Microbacterium sp. CPCC 204701 TaxID=2493084 RepID=UPI00197B2D4B